MSRIIHLRSPHFVKASAIEGKTLTDAQVDLYVWQGKLEDQPTTPTESLQKSTEDSGKNYVVFEISELCRSFIEYSFNGRDRSTEPIYINTEVTMNYSDGTNTLQSDIFFGVDGYRDFKYGLQTTENLFQNPAIAESITEADNITISIEDSLSGKEDREYENGQDLLLTATYTPSNATLQWFKDGTAINNATAATYAITGSDGNDSGEYFCRAYLNAGEANETNQDSNIIVYTIEICPAIYFMPDAQGSTYLSAGGAAGQTLVVTTEYGTDCYAEIMTDDVYMANGDASPFTVTSVTPTDLGSDFMRTTITLTTKHKNTGVNSTIKDRLIVNYYDETLKLKIPKNINVQQISASGAIHSVGLSNTDADQTAGTVKAFIRGDVGAKYNLEMFALVTDTDEDGNLEDEADYNWISNNAFSSISGTIDADGENEVDITYPANDTSVQREFRVIATNAEDSTNRVLSPLFTQDVIAKYANLQFTDITFDSAATQDIDFTYYCNADAEIRITQKPDAFRLVLPEVSNPITMVVYQEESEITYLKVSATPTTGSTATVRALANNGILRDGEISIRLDGEDVWRDMLTLTQPGTAEFLIWQSILDGEGNRTGITTFTTASAKAGTGLGYWLYVNSSVDYTINVPPGAKLSRGLLDGSSTFGGSVQGMPGLTQWTLTYEEDQGVDDETYILTAVSGGSSVPLTVTRSAGITVDENGPVLGALKVYKTTRANVLADWVIDTTTEFTLADLTVNTLLDGWAFKASATDTLAGTLDFQWWKTLNPDKMPDNWALQGANIITEIDDPGDTLLLHFSQPTEVFFYASVENLSTGLGNYTDVYTFDVKFDGEQVEWIDVDINESIDPYTMTPYYKVGVNGVKSITTISGFTPTQSWTLFNSSIVDAKVTDSANNVTILNQYQSVTITGNGIVEIVIPENEDTSQKFINLTFTTTTVGFQPARVVKYTQDGVPIDYSNFNISTPILDIGFGNNVFSNSGSSNASDTQTNNSGGNETTTVEESQTFLLQNLENEVIAGNGGTSSVETVTVIHNEPEVVANTQIAQVINDLANLQDLLDSIDEEKLDAAQQQDEDYTLAEVVKDSPVVTASPSNTTTPTPYSPPQVIDEIEYYKGHNSKLKDLL